MLGGRCDSAAKGNVSIGIVREIAIINIISKNSSCCSHLPPAGFYAFNALMLYCAYLQLYKTIYTAVLFNVHIQPSPL